MKPLTDTLLLVLTFGMLISCNAKSEKPASESPQKITIETADFAFVNIPDTIVSGLTTFHIKNSGTFPHNAILVKIPPEHTYDELIQFMNNNMGKHPDWATMVGGPSAPLSGESSEATVNLEPGNYAAVCVIPVPAEEPHFMKGMTHPLTVIEGEGVKTEEPEADVTIVMNDYSFKVTPEIKTGTQTIRVENEGTQPHEFLLVRLEEGKEIKDVLGWFGQVITNKAGPLPEAPGTFLNGVSAIDKGVVNYITVNFTPGDYALICPVPDTKDGKPHFAHGMVKQFSVTE
ncbi:MAG TPA: hypothetical protein VF181_10930 [Balneolaceae bacterium]